MSMYRFTGTLKEIEHSSSNTILKFTPDREYSVVVKSGKDESKFAVLLPANSNGTISKRFDGIAFVYTDNVCVEIIHMASWFPTWELNMHYEFVLETARKANCEVNVEGIRKSKWFKIISICGQA